MPPTMPDPLPLPLPLSKPRSLSTAAAAAAALNPPAAPPWTTARCHRLLRPLASKLQALKNIIQSNPSATANTASRPRPKHDPSDPDALFVAVVEKAAGSVGARPRPRPRRTYSSAGSGPRSNSRPPTSAPPPTDYLSIWGDPIPTDPDPPKRPPRVPNNPDTNTPNALLHTLKPLLHPSIFSVYTGIYTTLDTILLSTSTTPTQVHPLRTLAARKLAHCILATTDEVSSDDIWYDAAAELGSSGEYLRDLVRWHAIELLRDATTDGLLPRLVPVLIALCRANGAESEAQSLLGTLFELNPVIVGTSNVAVETVGLFPAEVQYRLLTRYFPPTVANPSWLGSAEVQVFLGRAVDEIDECGGAGAGALVGRALEAAFGLAGCVRKAPVMPYRVGTKAEGVVLKMVGALITRALEWPGSNAVGVLRGLVRGFLRQEGSAVTEDVWGARWPVAGKVAVLLWGLGREEGGIVDVVAGCLMDVAAHGGREGVGSLAAFVAGCFGAGYKKGERDEVQTLAGRLLALAGAGGTGVLETPRVGAGRKVLFTPGVEMAPEVESRETRRYLVCQLALQIAVSFSLGEEVKRDAAWVRWLGRFEDRVIGLKIRTPGRVKAILEDEEEEEEVKKGAGEKRKGWRYEEGLDIWVALGATPGRPKGNNKGVFMACVEVPADGEEDWRDQYEAFDDIASDAGGEYSSRPVTPTSRSTTDDDDDDEFYSNIRTTPPRTLRRSPRGTARIRRSLASFAVNLSSPIFTRLRTPAQRSSVLGRPFGLSAVVESSPGSPSKGWWEEEERGGDSSPVVRRTRREEEEEGDVSTLGLAGVELCASSPPVVRSGGAVSLDDLMDISSDEEVLEETDRVVRDEPSEEDEDIREDLFNIAINTALPLSSPPPPTPPPPPRRPKRTSLGAMKSMLNINALASRTPSSEPAPKDTSGKAAAASAPTPRRRITDDARQQKRIEKSARRRRRARERKRLRVVRRDEGFSADELGL